MSGRLQGKVCLLTGAATGIGEAIAHKFASEGAKLVLNGLSDDPLPDVVQALRNKGHEVVAYSGDVADETHAQACVETALKNFGKLEVLVNNAAQFLVTPDKPCGPEFVRYTQERPSANVSKRAFKVFSVVM